MHVLLNSREGAIQKLELTQITTVGEKAKRKIFSRRKAHLDDAELMIALLDGSQVEDGSHGRSDIFTPENHLNRKLSVSGLIPAGRAGAVGQ
jgi:hypothetical protein